MMVTVFVLANLAVDVLNAALDPRLRRHEEARREGYKVFRWPVKLALLVIALLAVIAIGGGWWLPGIQQRLTPSTAAAPPGAQRTGGTGLISAGYFLPPAGRHPRFAGGGDAVCCWCTFDRLAVGGSADYWAAVPTAA